MRHNWKSYFDSLTPTQQAAVLAYEGDDTIGPREVAPPHFKAQRVGVRVPGGSPTKEPSMR